MSQGLGRASIVLGAVLVTGLLASCSSDSGASQGVVHSTHPSTPHSSKPTGPRPTQDPYPALCRLIAVPDAQSLFSRPLGPMTTGGGSDCQFAPRGTASDADILKVYLRLDDGDKTLFNHVGDISYGRFTPLTGLGYQAKWGSQGFGPPTVVDVRSGSFTCTVIPPSNEAATTLDHPGQETDAPIDRSASTAFARSIGLLCRDIFRAH